MFLYYNFATFESPSHRRKAEKKFGGDSRDQWVRIIPQSHHIQKIYFEQRIRPPPNKAKNAIFWVFWGLGSRKKHFRGPQMMLNVFNMSPVIRSTSWYQLYGASMFQTYYFAILLTPLYLQVLELGALFYKNMH